MNLYTKVIETPVGNMFAAANDLGIFLFDFLDRRGGLDIVLQKIKGRYPTDFLPGDHPKIVLLQEQLQAYFDKRLQVFDLDLYHTCSDFQLEVYEVLRRIPFGDTMTYAKLAAAIGNTKAVRAVARANAENHFAIIIPCHRVVGSDGELTGYSGGLERKHYLLQHEDALSNTQLSLF